MDLIKFKDVWEMYRIKFVADGKTSWENFWALKDISFKAEKGETLGIIGENGSGKSTILKLIMDMLRPDRGEIEVKGKVSGLLELGAGFQPELTGRENVYLNAGLFGLTRSEIEAKYEEIANFASLGKFINAPAKCYSQGMFVRLAFSIAIHAEPDILLIDDTLAVGDEAFQRKCIKKIFELKEQGKTIVFVTHDMNMLSRLCKRAIFLKEGRIVRDGPADNVIPLYTQMVGERRGVAILEKKPLNLVFNNGRLFLNWQDKLLTPNFGLYTSFLLSSKWHSSSQADWQVEKDGGNKLVARGKFHQLGVEQIWRLAIVDNYEIKWDIEMVLQETLEIEEGSTNIMLTNEYSQWFTNSGKGEFPLIEYNDKDWQGLLENNRSIRCIGVRKNKTSNGEIPSLIFEQFNYTPTIFAQILNADYLINSRVLQYKTLGLENYSATHANRFIYFSGRIILDVPDIEYYLGHSDEEFNLSNDKLRLIFDDGRVLLCHEEIKLTKANHIHTSIYANGRWYFSYLARWEVKKEKNNKLIVRGTWPGLPIMQIWELEITGETSFLWKIKIQVNKEVNIEEQNALFMCSEEYKFWFCNYGSGGFPESFLELHTDILQRCIPDGTIGINSKNKQFPALSLNFSKGVNKFAKIFNSDFYIKARILRLETIEPEKNTKFLPGEYECFKIEAALEKDKQLCLGGSANILQGRRLKFVFGEGRGRIYRDGLELTKRLGLYTSLRSQGRWHDSASSALWKIEKNNADIIKAVGKWLYLPVIQYWEITLKEDKFIEFSVKMEVNKEIEIDRLQTNLMLTEKYKEWLTNKESGAFSEFKGDVDDDWEVIWFQDGGISKEGDYIGVLENYKEHKHLPTIKFLPHGIDLGWNLNIKNADVYHRGRVLQYLNRDKRCLSSGEYSYYKGKIAIEEP